MPETPLGALRQLTKAWLRKDGEEMARWLTPDATEIGPAFKAALVGRKAFLRQYRASFDGDTHIDYRIVRPRTVPLSPGLVLIYFHYTMRTTTGDIVRDSHGKESVLVGKHGGRWRVKFIHWHEDQRE